MRLGAVFAVYIASLILVPATGLGAEGEAPHNVVLFVADGLRANMVNDQTAPSMAKLAREGVHFINSHAMFPTFTMTNASAFATGHAPGDTGVFSNTIYVGFPVPAPDGSVTPFLERDDNLAGVDKKFGNFLNEPSLFELARNKGYQTASIGKVGPALLFDHVDRAAKSIIIDDWTGPVRGIPLSSEIAERLTEAKLSTETPERGKNEDRAGTKTPNLVQQDYFVAATTRAVLPLFASKPDPFLLVFWSRDPDGTQHNEGDSQQTLIPGINGPTSLAAIRNADDDLSRIRAALAELGLTQTTDIVVVADHGFSTISKESGTSPSTKKHYKDYPPGTLPLGFLAFDLADMFRDANPASRLFDPDSNNAEPGEREVPKFGNGLIGEDAQRPKLIVTAGGGSDLIYIPEADSEATLAAAKELAGKVVAFLLKQDYVSGIFVRSDLGTPDGTLPLSYIMLEGDAVTPKPAIVVSFRSFDTVCGEPTRCAVEVADTVLQQGHGMHGTFSRADTWNFMAAVGPDFRSGFVDTGPASNADIARTVAHVLKLESKDTGKLVGRVLEEALPGGALPEMESAVIASAPGYEGLRTVVQIQKVGNTCYFDAGGFIGRTVGLSPNALLSTDLSPPPSCGHQTAGRSP